MSPLRYLKNLLFTDLTTKGSSAIKSSPIPVSKTHINPEQDKIEYEGILVPRYPPFVTGLPVIPPDVLLQTQSVMIGQIKHVLGLNPPEFETLILPLITNYASFVHLLPASESHHHRGAGGLFRHSLEVGFWASKFAEGQVFTFGKTPVEKKKEESRWMVAAFVSAFLHDLGKSSTDMAVVSPCGVYEWSPYVESLFDWSTRVKVDRYFLRWRENRHKNHEQAGILLSNQVLPVELKSWLTLYTPDILRSMLEASTCRGNHKLTSLVVKADSVSVEKDLKNNNSMGIDSNIAVPVERHILDAIRRLISTSQWTVNKKGSRVWVSRTGVFIVWKLACQDITRLLAEDNVRGIPRDPETIADLLIDRGIAEELNIDDHHYRYWDIAPLILDSRSGLKWLRCIKIAAPEIIFTSQIPHQETVFLKDSKALNLYLQDKAEEVEKAVDIGKKTKEDNRKEALKIAAQTGISFPSSQSIPSSAEQAHLSDEHSNQDSPYHSPDFHDVLSEYYDLGDPSLSSDNLQQAPIPVIRNTDVAPKNNTDDKQLISPPSANVSKPSRKNSIPPMPKQPKSSLRNQADLMRQSICNAQSHFDKQDSFSSDMFKRLLIEIESGTENITEIFTSRFGKSFLQFPRPFLAFDIVEIEFLKDLSLNNYIIPNPDDPTRYIYDHPTLGKSVILHPDTASFFNALKQSYSNPYELQSTSHKSPISMNNNENIPSKFEDNQITHFKDRNGASIEYPDYIHNHMHQIIYKLLYDIISDVKKNPLAYPLSVNDDPSFRKLHVSKVHRRAQSVLSEQEIIMFPSMISSEASHVISNMDGIEMDQTDIKVLL